MPGNAGTPAARRNGRGAQRPRTALVAAADGEIRAKLERLLVSADLRVVTADDGEKAIWLADTEQADVIVVSGELPTAAVGVDLARALRADPQTAIVPLLHISEPRTGVPEQPHAIDGSAIDAYLTHPVDPVELIANVRALIRIGDYELERTELLARAEDARESAVRANRAKSEFLATMSHELRTPLNAVLGYAQLLDMGVLGPVTPLQHEHLDRLRTSSVHLLSLVNDVLDLSRVDAGRLDIAQEPGSLHEAADSALALVRPQALARNIVLHNDCDSGTRRGYIGDPDRVRQILANLLTNSIKFTDPGGHVTLSCGIARQPPAAATLDGASPWAFASVADTGIGIGPDVLAHVFEPFVQAETGHTRERGGTGLGLAISRRLARLMHGDLTIWSDPGHGSIFTLWLPTLAHPEDSTSTDRESARAAALEAQVSRHAPPTEEVIGMVPSLTAAAAAELELIGRALAAEAHQMATDYVIGLRHGSVVPPGVVLADIQLRDHSAALFVEFATALIELGNLRERADALLRDGSELLRVIAELHGVQRYRVGWSESDMEADAAVMSREVLATLERVAPAERGEGYRLAGELLASLCERARANAIRALRSEAAANAR